MMWAAQSFTQAEAKARVVGLAGATGGTSVLQGSSGVQSPLGHGLILFGAEEAEEAAEGSGAGRGHVPVSSVSLGPGPVLEPSRH